MLAQSPANKALISHNALAAYASALDAHTLRTRQATQSALLQAIIGVYIASTETHIKERDAFRHHTFSSNMMLF